MVTMNDVIHSEKTGKGQNTISWAEGFSKMHNRA